MRPAADMKESDAANHVNELMRKGGCSDLDCILMKIDKRYVGQLQCSPTSNRARTIFFSCSFGYRMGYPRVVPI